MVWPSDSMPRRRALHCLREAISPKMLRDARSDRAAEKNCEVD